MFISLWVGRRVAAHATALLLIVVLLVLEGLVWKDHVPGVWSAAGQGQVQTVVAVGDSITYGYGDTAQPGGWVTGLVHRLRADEPTAPRVVNAGLNGDTATGVLRRLDHDVLSFKPALVIVSIGTNDFDYDVSPAAFRTSLSTIVSRLRRAGALVLLVGTLPEAGLMPARLAAQRSYNAIIPRVATSTGVGYFDEFDRWLALGSNELTRLRRDSEHPNHIGYQLLADDMAAFLESQYLDARGHIIAPAAAPASNLLGEGRAVLHVR